ncbi:MAG: membrane protein insertion efficiency factor YidD [Spirochaetales bacterium]
MIQKIVKILLYPIKLLLIGLIYFYKIFISPILPKSCIYTPTCSTYSLEAIKRFGPIKGSFLSAKRIISCNPMAKGGFDPVPDNIKGDAKWVL